MSEILCASDSHSSMHLLSYTILHSALSNLLNLKCSSFLLVWYLENFPCLLADDPELMPYLFQGTLDISFLDYHTTPVF